MGGVSLSPIRQMQEINGTSPFLSTSLLDPSFPDMHYKIYVFFFRRVSPNQNILQRYHKYEVTEILTSSAFRWDNDSRFKKLKLYMKEEGPIPILNKKQ